MKKFFSIIAIFLLTQFFCFMLIQSAGFPIHILFLDQKNHSEGYSEGSREVKPLTPIAVADVISNEEVPERVLDPNKPMIALTFDDGPSQNTARILAILDQYNAKATFFVVGSRVGTWAEAVGQIVEQGSEIGNHSWSHQNLTRLSLDDIKYEMQRTNSAAEDLTGVRPVFFRSPYVPANGRMKSAAGEMGMAIIAWSVDPQDWRTRNADQIYNAVMSKAYDGSIVICHDLVGQTAAAMERIIPELIDQGYQLVTISELFALSGKEPEAGRIYSARP